MNFGLDTGCPDCRFTWLLQKMQEEWYQSSLLKFTVHKHSVVSWHTVIVSDDMVS